MDGRSVLTGSFDHRVRELLLEKLSPGNAPTRMEVSACVGGSRDWRTRKIGQALERLDPILSVADQVPRHFPLAPERQPQTPNSQRRIEAFSDLVTGSRRDWYWRSTAPLQVFIPAKKIQTVSECSTFGAALP
ncbi:hypothetical protein F5144DRAFT_645475 [Chaetomium tenue]|uniref:Uncharacterized protein n=1 Tax=Chaetomium tenue TaxID=1854479 RepID=A0ACB7PBX6_9PEZI|nr:hypothetical protein F5144DRAFT_645475 [Chaetomium globosum]